MSSRRLSRKVKKDLGELETQYHISRLYVGFCDAGLLCLKYKDPQSPLLLILYHMVDPHRKDLVWASLWDKDTANGKKLGALSLVFMA